MTKPLIAANWKMNKNVSEGSGLIRSIRDELASLKSVDVVICPPFVSLTTIHDLLQGTNILLGAQNAYYEESGAFTGEISLGMLDGFCNYVIIGHSERRNLFGENDKVIRLKLNAVLEANMKPILCVGERLEERDAGKTEEVVVNQLSAALEDCQDIQGLAVAYEPVWAIGTGRAATNEMVNDVMSILRANLKNRYGSEAAAAVRLLYGGSVTSQNISQFAGEENIDGALVGGASLKADSFSAIVKNSCAISSK